MSITHPNDPASGGNGALAGLPFIDLEEVKPDPAAVERAPGDFALRNQVLPIREEDGVLLVAIGSLSSLQAVDDLGVLLGAPVRAVLAQPNLIRERIEERFLEGMLQHLPSEESLPAEIDDSVDLADLQRLAGETAVVQLVNLIFAQAVRDLASDIHI
jgi:type II secretory ATPase GspE/PulE/Tfp pilus assembly ATPase PilB-like protein